MVHYFVSNVVSPPVTLFMGLDKYENEELIKWGWPEDVWFHVDKLSSAHVYLRLQPGQAIDDIPSAVLEDAAQLVKANSISGNKMNDIDVVYTMWYNLKKTDGMDVGQVSFHKDKEVRKMRVAKRVNEIVNRLNKTKTTKEVDLRGEREARDAIEREDQKRIQKALKETQKEEAKKKLEEAELRDAIERENQKRIQKALKETQKEEAKKKLEEAELRSYTTLMKPELMTSNRDGNDSDDFM